MDDLAAHRLPNGHPTQILDGRHVESQGAAYRKLFMDSRRDKNPGRQSWKQVELVELVQVLER